MTPKFTPVAVAISFAITTFSANAALTDDNIEVIKVKGTYFDDYKVDEASGAMRMDVSLLETPQSVTVISETIIDEQLATTLGAVVANDASLTAGSKQRNREVFSSRGFELSSSTGYLRDGHQHWSHYQQPIETLERVEIIKGPSSILYGQSAPGGLVNMVTKKPTAKSMLDVSADVDQFGSTRVTLDAGGALTESEDLRYRGVLVKQDANYERKYQNGEARERDRFLGSLVVDYDVNDDLMVRFHYDQTQDKAGLDTGAWLDDNGDVIGDENMIYDMSWAFTDINVENYGVDMHYYLSDAWQVKIGYNKQHFERQRFESSPKKPADYALGDSYTSSPYDRFDDWQFSTAFIDFVGEIEIGNTQHQILIGANKLDYYYGQLQTNGQSFDTAPGQPESSRPDISYKTDESLYTSEYDYYGIYLQDLVTLNDHWQVSIGGRFDKQIKEGANNESFLPKLGVIYHPIEDATIYVSYTEGFEPQSTDTLNDDTDRNHGMALDAITSEQIEIGAKWQLTERLLISGAYFDIEKSGTLITESLDGDPQYDTVTTQSGLQRHKGFEMAAQGAVTDKFFVMATAMHLDATYERDELYQGNTPIDAPEWAASFWSRYEFTQDIAVNAGIFYTGERYADAANTVTKDGYTRVDLGATYSMLIANKDVDLRVNVENLFDTDYVAGGSTSNATVGDGRTLRFEVKASF